MLISPIPLTVPGKSLDIQIQNRYPNRKFSDIRTFFGSRYTEPLTLFPSSVYLFRSHFSWNKYTTRKLHLLKKDCWFINGLTRLKHPSPTFPLAFYLAFSTKLFFVEILFFYRPFSRIEMICHLHNHFLPLLFFLNFLSWPILWLTINANLSLAVYLSNPPHIFNIFCWPLKCLFVFHFCIWKLAMFAKENF